MSERIAHESAATNQLNRALHSAMASMHSLLRSTLRSIGLLLRVAGSVIAIGVAIFGLLLTLKYGVGGFIFALFYAPYCLFSIALAAFGRWLRRSVGPTMSQNKEDHGRRLDW